MTIFFDRLKDKYGNFELVRLTGGFTNAAYLLKGTDPPFVAKVAKLASQDIENECHSLRFLANQTITPKLIDRYIFEKTQVVIMTFEPGANGQSILDTNDLARAEKVFTNMGLCLAEKIHSFRFDGQTHEIREGNLPFLSFDLDFVPFELRVESRTLLNKLEVKRDEWVLTHGDFGSHNVLFADGEPLTVIDWEWTEWFHPLVDIAWACWNTQLHYPKMADRLNHALIESYQSRRPFVLDPETLKALVLYKLWNILMKVRDADGETKQKWVNRLQWTFENKWI
ncbi:aminoglycoside phosphotransferase family protein [Camelliibacillus cellulosilyticus]|uniref:Aminoglycoside phosphotransferase family protein n=1 Tax=Camelliibacillus cellulosilyticus TaxID=2174486 RepID=A0ABV9GTG9_9BACL